MRAALVLSLALLAAPASAQEDDRGFLTAFLEDNLSDAGREVTITGFAGALSSQASIDELTIADDSGIWLTIRGVTLDWSRSSLLSGEVNVSELSAQEIILARLPDTPEGSVSPEARAFSLPELPVSIRIDRLAAERIEVDPSVLGQSVEGSLEAALTLAGGDGSATLDLIRTGGGPAGEIVLDAAYSNATRELQIDLTASEGPGGLVVSLLDIPGAPAAEFRMQGTGPLEDHRADIRLATDGQERLAGTVTLQQEGESYRLLADVAGNLVPLLAPDHVDFFGAEVALTLDALRSPTGRMVVDAFALTTRALSLGGSGTLAADGLPEVLDLQGTLAAPDGSPVLLPFGDTPTRVDGADLILTARLGSDAGWRATVAVRGLDRTDLAAERIALEGSGRIGRTPAGNTFGGTLRLAAAGLAPADPALAAAIGPDLAGSLRFHALQGSGALTLSDLSLRGEGFSAKGFLQISGLEKALETAGKVTVTADDLARFSGLAGRPLAGKGTVRLEGSASPLSGAFDAVVEVEATSLSLDIESLDRLLAGQSRLTLSALRDTTGTTLRALDLAAGALTATASGTLATGNASLAGDVTLSDLSILGPGLGGSASLAARFDGTADQGRLSLDGSARSLRTGTAEADRLLAGENRLAADLTLRDRLVQIDRANLSNPQLEASVTGRLEDAVRRLAISARLANLGLLIPDLSGPLTVTGDATQDASGYALDLAARGPGGVDARINGRLAQNLSSGDLAITGTGQAGLANLFISPRALEGLARFDLRLNGPFRLASLSGRVTLANGRLSDPGLGVALERLEAVAQLQGGEAQLSATARLSSGGTLRLDGPVGLAAPFPARLQIGLEGIRLIDPELYEAFLRGTLSVNGPLTGGAQIAGALTMSEAELRVPSSGFASAAALLEVTHVNEPAEVRATRARAGLLGDGNGGPGGSGGARPFGLDVTVSAPARIFVRGRGIDAELGGQIRLLGTTAQILPSGAFNLIRGRLDILGKRLTLSTANLQLEGSFVPTLLVSAQTENDGVVSIVNIEGPADNPSVRFISIPELPQEEALARLLFGRGLENLSALQAAQLANAIAVLAGRGGEGLVNRLRRGFGLDDLDLTTSENGETALTAGKYISDNAYTEVEIEQGGKSRISLNLDLRPGVTLRGRVGDDGQTGIGIFVERDY